MAGRPRLDSFGKRAAVLVMDCSPQAFGNRELLGRLSSSMASRPQLSGVFLMLFENGRYRTHYASNPMAGMPAAQATVDLISRAPDVTV